MKFYDNLVCKFTKKKKIFFEKFVFLVYLKINFFANFRIFCKVLSNKKAEQLTAMNICHLISPSLDNLKICKRFRFVIQTTF